MVSLRTEIQRIRDTIEHRVYDFDEDEDEEPDDIEQLSHLSKLRQEGALTDEGFAKIKAGSTPLDSRIAELHNGSSLLCVRQVFSGAWSC